MVIDYRHINQFMIEETSEISKIFEGIIKMGTAKIFSKIDLKNGFNQIYFTKKADGLPHLEKSNFTTNTTGFHLA